MTIRSKFFITAVIAFNLLTFATWYFGRNWIHAEFLPDQGASWYYWKLPVITFWPRFTGWLFFILHLLTSWFILYKAKQEKDKHIESEKFGELTKYNYALLFTHIGFSILHLIQTAIWYDSLAHDTPVWLSQYSVILMLVLIMILVNKSRGLIFGYKLPIPEAVVGFVAKYHSYYILLALIFTFWYHPMEVTAGHLVGFFYMFMLMIQSTLMYTKNHFNRLWIFILEILVLIHGTTIAIAQGTATKDVWPLFTFGFGFIAVFTQIYILKLPKWGYILLQSLYFIAILLVYSGVLGIKRTFGQIYEIAFIPVTEYSIALFIVAIGSFILFLTKDR
jgi:hypothetical protein